MTARNHNQVLQSLLKKGFEQIKKKDHIVLRFKYINEVKEAEFRTKLSHNRQDLNDHLLTQMAKQCGLNKQQFLDLVDCPLSQQKYEEILNNSTDKIY